MKGDFELGEQKMTINNLDYQVPGAEVAMNGVYTLDGETFNFEGTARLQAKVSEMVTGWKSWALKVADPLFMKNGAGTEVPITITGTRSEPHFGVEMGKVFGHKDKDQNNGTQESGADARAAGSAVDHAAVGSGLYLFKECRNREVPRPPSLAAISSPLKLIRPARRASARPPCFACGATAAW